MSERLGSLMRPVNIIVTTDQNGGILLNRNQPWKNEPFANDNITHFEKITKDGILIMNSSMYDTIIVSHQQTQQNIFPGKKQYLVTDNPAISWEGITTVSAFNLAVELEEDNQRPIFILGDERLFIEAFPYVDKIFMTIVKKHYHCDKFFPITIIDKNFTIQEGHKTNDLYFITYQRR